MRCNMGFIGRLTLVGACALALSAGSSQANTVSVRYAGGGGVGIGQTVIVTSELLNNGAGGSDTVQAKVLDLKIGSVSNDYATFCTEVAQHTNGSFTEYHQDSLADLPTPGDAMGADKAAAIKKMWAYAGANKFTNPEYAAAFQVAVWEVVEDFNGTLASLNVDVTDANAGDFTAVSDDPSNNPLNAGILSNLFGAAVDPNQGQANLVGLASGSHQDYLVEVPEPSSIALLAIGGVCAGIPALRRRRRA